MQLSLSKITCSNNYCKSQIQALIKKSSMSLWKSETNNCYYSSNHDGSEIF